MPEKGHIFYSLETIPICKAISLVQYSGRGWVHPHTALNIGTLQIWHFTYVPSLLECIRLIPKAIGFPPLSPPPPHGSHMDHAGGGGSPF